MIKTQKINFLLLVVLITCSGCSKNSRQKIDYAQLNTLKTKVALEIGESKQFLPGQLKGLYVNSDGIILVSDRASTSITQFDANGNFMATVAKKGGGPGELSQYFTMVGFNDDTLMIRSNSGKRALFAKGKNDVYEHIQSTVTESAADRPVFTISKKSANAYYAQTGLAIRNIQEATKNKAAYYNSVLLTTDFKGHIIDDSLTFLRKDRSYITQINEGIRINDVPYRYEDHFEKLHNEIGSFMIARPDSNALQIYNQDLIAKKNIPLMVKKRPVTSSDLDYVLKNIDKQISDKIEVRINDYKPPYLDVWATQKHIWLKTDRTKNGKPMVIIDYNGKPVGKFMLPKVDTIEQIKGNSVYTIHHSKTEGNTIRKYSIAI